MLSLKERVKTFLILCAMIFDGQQASANNVGQQVKADCSTASCRHPGSDDSQTPGAIAERAGAKMLEDVRQHGSDRDRWQSFTLYNEETDPNNLHVSLIKDAGFVMRLEPSTGLLRFTKGRLSQAFAIAAPARASDEWTRQELCPNYGIHVLQASASSALVVKYCRPYTYGNRNTFTSQEYYLYDEKTATMQALWFSSTDDASIRGPFIDRRPIAVQYPYGYEVKWKFHDATNPMMGEISFKNRYRYVRDGKSHTWRLACTDLTNVGNPEGDGDGDMCDGPPNLRRVSNREEDR